MVANARLKTKTYEELLPKLSLSKDEFRNKITSIKRWVVDELLEPYDHWILDLNSELSAHKVTNNLILPTVWNFNEYRIRRKKRNREIIQQNRKNKNIKELSHFIDIFGTDAFEYISYRITQIIKSVDENNNFSQLKFNSGARWNNKTFDPKDPKLATDSTIIALLLKTELESFNLPNFICLKQNQIHQNNEEYPFVKLYNKELSQFVIHYQKRDWLIEDGENNLFIAIALFFLIIKTNCDCFLNGVNIIENLFLTKRI
ncbi:hypothetical protein M0812_04145 [Anaeramoeba flamelloides]|uniref:Uncharacterized protein n=1 Tax=Anaeramoeba flamelloides TaxID=1746091 RepID=A0AAV8ADM1_9EUKA|nr:hypothetical protein M0812_04145 [Anaeramoeba flamelloides]